MNINFNFQILLDAIGFVQGVTLAAVLLIMNRRKYRSTFFLGLFLLFYSLELGTWISTNPEISVINSKSFLLPFNFSWLLFPLFFLYCQQVSIFANNKTKYWILYPGIASFLAQIIIFFLPFETKQAIDKSEWHKLIFWILGNYYSWIIGIWNLWLLYRHKIEVKNTYSYISFKELQWARIFLIYLLTTSMITHILAYGFLSNLNDIVRNKIIFSFMDLVAIYWVSYFGIVQRNVRALLTKNWDQNNSQNNSISQNHGTTIIPERLEDLMHTIGKYMIATECFTNPELTIVELAEGLKVHPKLVSTAINTIKKQNFNSYVNQYRIKKAEVLIRNNEHNFLSMEGICSEVGFKSKSAFYSAFKKETGTTPTKFKEKLVA
ncbi:MAG: helix-turn-helix domain-containing protein [Maribacter sp.]|nr:helix-turn-helix domain-containing protein [Maribacter sp.]